MKDQKKTCPSAVCEPGSNVIGIVNRRGTVDLLSKPIPVDEEFVAEASKGRSPETRFRFSNKCAQGGCNQWNGTGCSIIQKVMEAIQPEAIEQKLPACSIRKTCRWYFQRGPIACSVCPIVITDNAE